MNGRPWSAFLALSLIWGTSFLWIKVAVQEIGPMTLVAYRLLFGLLGLLAYLALTRTQIRIRRERLGSYLVLAVLNTALPFTLISWGETLIDSARASILNGSMPIFTVIIAHLWLRDEPLTTARVVWVAVGFAGVGLLVSDSLGPGSSVAPRFLGQAAVLVAAISYAFAITFARRKLRGEHPVLQSLMIVLLSDLMLWVAAAGFERPLQVPRIPETWVAIVWLGVLGTGLAYVLYFYLINVWGSTRTSLVTYLVPVIGVILGVVFLRETFSLRLVLGTALVVGGIGFVNRGSRPEEPAKAAAATD